MQRVIIGAYLLILLAFFTTLLDFVARNENPQSYAFCRVTNSYDFTNSLKVYEAEKLFLHPHEAIDYWGFVYAK